MLHYGSTNQMSNGTGRVVLVLNETNTDVRMYIEEFILVDIWIHCCTRMEQVELNMHGNAVVYIHTQQ